MAGGQRPFVGHAQQKVQAVRLASDDGNTDGAQGARRVVGLEGRVARTATGAEPGRQRLVDEGEASPGHLADRPSGRRRPRSGPRVGLGANA